MILRSLALTHYQRDGRTDITPPLARSRSSIVERDKMVQDRHIVRATIQTDNVTYAVANDVHRPLMSFQLFCQPAFAVV